LACRALFGRLKFLFLLFDGFFVCSFNCLYVCVILGLHHYWFGWCLVVWLWDYVISGVCHFWLCDSWFMGLLSCVVWSINLFAVSPRFVHTGLSNVHHARIHIHSSTYTFWNVCEQIWYFRDSVLNFSELFWTFGQVQNCNSELFRTVHKSSELYFWTFPNSSEKFRSLHINISKQWLWTFPDSSEKLRVAILNFSKKSWEKVQKSSEWTFLRFQTNNQTHTQSDKQTHN
jgi:hypothetical protein